MTNHLPFTEPIGGKRQGQQNLNWAIDQNGDAYFAGNMRIDGDLSADDITIDDLTMDSLTITGNATIGGTLAVTGATTVSTLTASGAVTLSTLTNGQVVYAGTSGILTGEAGFTYDEATNILAVPTAAVTTLTVVTAINPTADNAAAIGTTSLRYTSVNSVLVVAQVVAAAGAPTAISIRNTQAAAADVGAGLSWVTTAVTQGNIQTGWNGAATTDAYMAFATRGSNSNAEKMRITSAGQLQIGSATTIGALLSVSSGNVILSATTLGTTATSGFTWLPVCAGVPTGVPTGHSNTGSAPVVYNNSNGRLYVYSAGSWGTV